MKKCDYTAEDKTALIEDVEWLRNFSFQEIQRFSQYLRIDKLRKDVVITKEGEKQKSLSVIIQGAVKVTKLDEFGNNKEIATFTKGKTFGEMSLIDGEPGSASVVTVEQVVLMTLDEERFKLLLDECPRMGVKLLLSIAKIISARLRMTSGRLVDYLDN